MAPVAVVVGVGAGIGAALVRRFSKTYTVAMIARNEKFLADLVVEVEKDGGKAVAFPADVSKADDITAAFERIRKNVGKPEILIYNAAMRPFGTIMETKASTFENTWRVNAFGAFLCSQQVIPDMLAARHGVIILTGATGGVKPAFNSAAFGPSKFAMRGLSQVMARDLGPKGIHVVWTQVDGPVDMPLIRQRIMPNAEEEDLLKPSAIAEAYWYLAHQDQSAWTLELDLRPFKEKF